MFGKNTESEITGVHVFSRTPVLQTLFNRFAHSAGPGFEEPRAEELAKGGPGRFIMEPTWFRNRRFFGPSWWILGPRGVIFRSPRGAEWPSRGFLGPLGGQVGVRRALWATWGGKGCVKKLYGRLLGSSWGHLGRSWARFGSDPHPPGGARGGSF